MTTTQQKAIAELERLQKELLKAVTTDYVYPVRIIRTPEPPKAGVQS